MPIDNSLRPRVIEAIETTWEQGCPVAGSTQELRDKIASVAIRRYHSMLRRGIRAGDGQDIRDLARGLVEAFERDRSLVGRLFVDYEYLASKILDAINSTVSNARNQ